MERSIMVTGTETTDETLADFLARIGNVPPQRVLLQPPPGTATEDDVLAAMERPRKRLCELIDGILVEKAMGFNESGLASFLIEILGAFVRTRNLGIVTAPDGAVRLWAGRVRIPDVAFVSWDRLPNRRRPKKPLPDLAPDLAIEILSINNTTAEMKKKREDYFAAGVKLVWEIDPESRIVTVYSSPDQGSVFNESHHLDGSNVLPGFSLSIRDLFAELDRHGAQA
jgi:Uma2 family endonuclease